ncbi:hypothetical protein AAFF27_11245 [Xylophilus sp. GW821-FHT01B05]
MKYLLLVGLFCGGTAMAQVPADAVSSSAEADVAQAKLRSIEEARGQLQARQLTEQTACYQKFAVNDCVSSVKEHYRVPLRELRQQELGVRDGERARKERERQVRLEEQRQQDLRNKESAAQRAQGSASPEQRQADADRQRQERDAAAPGQAERARAERAQQQRSQADAAASRAQRAADAPEQRRRFDENQRAAEARRQSLQRRLQEQKDSGKPPAQPLPIPP